MSPFECVLPSTRHEVQCVRRRERERELNKVQSLNVELKWIEKMIVLTVYWSPAGSASSSLRTKRTLNSVVGSPFR